MDKNTLSAAKRREANARARELRERIADYCKVSATIPTGINARQRIEAQKNRILKILGGAEGDWNDWKWQLKNRITEPEMLAEIIELSPQELEDIRATGAKYRWALSPYYASLIDPDDPNCPVRLQSVPKITEILDETGTLDPMAEERTSPVAGITRRYPDRLIVYVTNQCAMYCRHCQRRRKIGETDENTPGNVYLSAWVNRDNPEIRDVLLTGEMPCFWIMTPSTGCWELDAIRRWR